MIYPDDVEQEVLALRQRVRELEAEVQRSKDALASRLFDVKAAAEIEREACAVVAEQWFRASRVQSADQHAAEHEVGLRIASAIRSQGGA